MYPTCTNKRPTLLTTRHAKVQWPLVLGIAIAACLPIFALILYNSYETYSREQATMAAKPGGFEGAPPPTSTPASEPQPGLLPDPGAEEVAPLPPPGAAEADAGGGVSPASSVVPAAPTAPPSGAPIEIGIAYGTEKRYWLQDAVEQFAETEAGKRIHVNLIPRGSVEGAQEILAGNEDIHVWAPASQVYQPVFLRDWRARFRGEPIVRGEPLALTPMVFVMWEDRYRSFTVKAPEVSLRNVYYAMRAKAGWGTIANRPEWGHFKFGHTHPSQSNSGLMTLILLGYDFYDKTSGLTVSNVMDLRFQRYLTEFGRGVTGLSNSTGNMMREMVYKGPQSFDALMVYESVAIDFIKKAEETWGRLYVVYPKFNIWNDNPYYILDTPWTTEAHQQAAEVFLEFLMSEPIQTKALTHGFRPGNPTVPVKFPGSPFVTYADRGLQIELHGIVEPPPPDVIENLQQSWLRNATPH